MTDTPKTEALEGVREPAAALRKLVDHWRQYGAGIEFSAMVDEAARALVQPSVSDGMRELPELPESICAFTPTHSDFERRQVFIATRVGSWPWLRGCINGIPKREEFSGGQRTRYVALDEVLGWIDEGERRASITSAPLSEEPELAITNFDPLTIAEHVCRSVAELPDRNSPEGEPDMMLVTGDELLAIVIEAFAENCPPEAAAPRSAAPEESKRAARYDLLRNWCVRQHHLYVTDGNNPVYEEELDRRLDAILAASPPVTPSEGGKQ